MNNDDENEGNDTFKSIFYWIPHPFDEYIFSPATITSFPAVLQYLQLTGVYRFSFEKSGDSIAT